MLNKALEEAKDISKKMKALAESNMAMNEELSRVQENLENMSEEEFQLLGAMEAGVKMIETEEELEKNKLVEINLGLLAKVTCISINKSILQKYASEDVSLGSRFTGLEEFLDLKELVSFGKLRESTELAHDFEDPCDNLCCSLSKSPEKLKEQTVVLEDSKPTAFSEQRKLNNSSFVGYHFGINPTFFANADHLEIKITSGSCGPLNGKEICPEVRNFEPCDIVGTMEMFWIDMYFPFTNHSFEHPLALRMMCGYEVSEKLAFVITKWSGEFVSKDKEILATWKGIKCFKFLGALAMVYAKQEDDVYYGQQRMIEFGLIGPKGHFHM